MKPSGGKTTNETKSKIMERLYVISNKSLLFLKNKKLYFSLSFKFKYVFVFIYNSRFSVYISYRK